MRSKADMPLIGLGLILAVVIFVAGKVFPRSPYTPIEAREVVEQLGGASAIAWFVGSIMAVSTYYHGESHAASLAFLGAVLNTVGALMTAAAVVIGAGSW